MRVKYGFILVIMHMHAFVDMITSSSVRYEVRLFSRTNTSLLRLRMARLLCVVCMRMRMYMHKMHIYTCAIFVSHKRLCVSAVA